MHSQHLATVTGWNLASLSIIPPTGFVGTFALTVVASSTETATGEIIDSAITLPVTVLPTNVTNVMSLNVNHATAPEAQNGSWFMDLSQIAFSDGHAAAMADTYFETMHQPAPVAIKGKVGAIHGEWDVAAWTGDFVPSPDGGAASRVAGNFIDINGYTHNSSCVAFRA